jgi:hypothetical protein
LTQRFRTRGCRPHNIEIISGEARGGDLEEGLVVVHDQAARPHAPQDRTPI